MKRRRLRSLAIVEWGNIPLQAIIWFGSIGLAVTVANVVGFALFAVLEHINYFHVQLMHDTRADWRRLRSSGPRRSHLAADLRAG